MNRKFRNRILISTTFFLFAFAQQDVKIAAWEKVKVKNGIVVYVRENSLSDVNEVRAEATVNATLSAVVYLIKHVEKQPDWAYATKEARVIKKINNYRWLIYTRTDAPWPVDDRDCVSDITMKQFSDSSIFIKTINVDTVLDEVENVVRIPMVKASWRLIPVDANTTKVRFQILVDLGGSVPAWVVNLFIENGPYNTMANFKEEVAKKKYQKIHLSYIKQP